jgi:hypothetical protein
VRWIAAVPAALLVASTAAADNPAPAAAHRCAGLPGIEQLRTWPIVAVCAPGGAAASTAPRRIRSLGDGTFVFSGRDGCFRGRAMRCSSRAPVSEARGQRRLPAAERQPRAQLEGGGWVHACPLAGLPYATLRIEPDHRVSLTDGARTVATVRLRDDFSGRDVEVSCARRFANLRVEYDRGTMYREVTLLWTRGRLVESGRGEGPVPPPPAP